MNGLIIMLCRNGLAYSKACLDTLLAQSVPVDILVVDNASTDGTAPWLISQQHRHPNLYRWSMQEVGSVAYCWNIALRWGWAGGHTEALVVNNDTELLPRTYEMLRDNLGDRGMLTAVGMDKDPAHPGLVIAYRPHPDYSCYMMAKWAHERVPFDEGYVGGYFEDARSHAMLYRAGIAADSMDLGFLHRSSGTLKSATPAEKARIDRNYAANKERFLAQYGCLPGTKAYERLFTTPLTTVG